MSKRTADAMQISYKQVKTCYKIKIDFRGLGCRFWLCSAVQTVPTLNNRASFTV